MTIRVLVAEDEEPLRDALVALIDSEPELELAGAVGDAETAIALAAASAPDAALVDVRMPGGGPAAVRGIRKASPETRIVALSAYEDRTTVFEMLSCGAVGYLVKGVSPLEIVDALRRAARGQASLSATVISSVVDELAADIADRAEAEETLRRSEEKFRGLLESSPDAMVIIDEHGEIVLVNPQAESMFGYKRDELIGLPVEVLLPEGRRELHVEHRSDYLKDPRTRPMGAGLELAGRRRDGSEFPVDISLSSIETSEGRLLTACVRDITERKAADEVVRKSEERFRALLESAPDAVVIADAGGRIVFVNQQTEQLFGYRRDELLGQPLETLLPDRFRTRHVDHRSGYLSDPVTRPMGVGLELAGRRKNGAEFPIDISLSALETEEGRLATAFIRDISERDLRIELEQALEERRALLAHLVAAGEEERRRIAGDIHDDSIQAITAAGIRLQLLRRKLDDPEQLELLGDLDQTIHLSISRLRHLLFELRPPALDNEGLAPALAMYLEQTRSESTTKFKLVSRLGSQLAGETRVVLYRIVQEALTNIRKHAKAETATITLEDRDGGYLARIRDDGAGFAADTSGSAPGHLGLVAMRERATLAGGWLRITSAPGQGTTVDVWIPPIPSGPEE